MTTKNQISRRSFLRQSRNAAVGVGLGLALPQVFLNRTKAATGQNPSELVRVGFIGTGNQGSINMKFFLANKSVAAVCDIDKSRLQSTLATVAKEQGKPVPGYEDYRKLLEDKSVDAVLIATPDHWHTLPVIHACQAGKDIYCEKPLTLTVAEGKVIRKVVRDTKRVLQTGSQQRSDPRFRSAIEMIRLGKIGKIQTVKVGLPKVNWDIKIENGRVILNKAEISAYDPAKKDQDLSMVPDSQPPAELNYDVWLGPAPARPYNARRVHYNFRFFWDYSGGQMTNFGAHHLDIAQWGLDMDNSGPISIEGEAKYDEQKRFETPTWCLLHYTYANGAKIVLEQGGKLGATFIGDQGTIYVTRGSLQFGKDEASLDDIRSLKDADIKHTYISSEHHQNWLDCIKSRKDPICNVEVGHRSATVCHLGNIALRHGKKIQWDPVAETIVGDPVAAQMLSRPYRAPYKLPEV